MENILDPTPPKKCWSTPEKNVGLKKIKLNKIKFNIPVKIIVFKPSLQNILKPPKKTVGTL